ncbi:heat shock 70 kDa protein 12A-like [Mytilus galloprovincialis]|uniref:heat shock 70 kDa protein 12A-like n=1 Tax=Mytilus galloprovincialis TaxID=29158 RepID=UPI003F7C9C79
MDGKQSTSAEQSRPSTAPPASQSPRSEDLSKRNRTYASEADHEAANIVKDIKSKNELKLLVAAIDFGTLYSGYACVTQEKFENNKGDNSKTHWPTWERDGDGGLRYKAPTSVLFRPNKTFHSFGFDAENYYYANSDTVDFKEWYFFKHFRTKLYINKDQITHNTIIEDSREAGNSMKAVDVFAAVIKYFKDHLLRNFKDRNKDKEYFVNNDIHWVITVPAIWDFKAKQFMKSAASKAGISGDQLTLALEPDAAFSHCRTIPVPVETTKEDDEKTITAMPIGSQHIVFTCRGKTTVVSVHKSQCFIS